MREYRVLKKNKFEHENFSILPIRNKDRYLIMKWRNEQIYHLRQNKPLTKEDQDEYFDNVINLLFLENKPNQLLFSFLNEQECIGYGGLVHINWQDKNAEVSFIMNTYLEETSFDFLWSTFLSLIEKVAFTHLSIHKLYVYAFDLRPHLYKTLEKCGFFLDARLSNHCYFRGEYRDVVIYSKIN